MKPLSALGRSRYLRALGLLSLFASTRCSSVLGIDEASCDPGLAACQSIQAPDEVQASALCKQYCDAVAANCMGTFAVYVGRATCLSVCNLLPEGAPDDDHVNSVHCRLHQAKLALEIEDPAVHCPGAGPGGNGLCGDNCQGLCSIMATACSSVYDSEQACREECSAVPDLEGYDISDNEGDSVQCRLWHASAATRAETPHCLHGSGASPCN